MKNTNTITQEIKQGPIGIYLMAMIIPLYQKFLGIAVLIIVLEFLIRDIILKREIEKPKISWKNPGLWMFLFYFMHVIGLLNTDNMKFANLDLGMKSTLAIFPLLFLFYRPVVKWHIFIRMFIIGALLSIAINLSLSISLYLSDHNPVHFYDSNFTHLMHRGFWAVYLSIAVFFLLKLGFQANSKKGVFTCFSLALFIAVFTVLSLSKMGLIILVLLFFWTIVKLIQRFKNKWALPISILFFIGVTYSMYAFVPVMKHRVDAMFLAMGKPISEYNMHHPGSTGARILVWNSSVELIKENFWIGVGTGDIKDELVQRNYDNGYIHIAEKNLNSHNQFLNSHIALGILAPLFLLMVIVTNLIRLPLSDPYYSWRTWIVVVLFLAMLTESMLEVEAGIVPYAFLLTFLTRFKEKEKDLIS